jgi:hypothetical protein
MVQTGRAISTYKRNLSTTRDAYFDLTLCYPINGSIVDGNSAAYFIGQIVVVFRYCRNFTSPFNPGMITEWTTETHIRRTDSKGNVTVHKEVSWLQGEKPIVR